MAPENGLQGVLRGMGENIIATCKVIQRCRNIKLHEHFEMSLQTPPVSGAVTHPYSLNRVQSSFW